MFLLFIWFGPKNERNQTNQLTRETRSTSPASLAQLSWWSVILLRHRFQAAACRSYLQLITMASAHCAGILPLIGPSLITPAMLIEQELATAQTAQQNGNHGKARVCARRAVARATEAWFARRPLPRWHGDAMALLRQIQQDASFPLSIRQAAERLSTPVTRQLTTPFTTDPVADARLIIAHLNTTSDNAP